MISSSPLKSFSSTFEMGSIVYITILVQAVLALLAHAARALAYPATHRARVAVLV